MNLLIEFAFETDQIGPGLQFWLRAKSPNKKSKPHFGFFHSTTFWIFSRDLDFILDFLQNHIWALLDFLLDFLEQRLDFFNKVWIFLLDFLDFLKVRGLDFLLDFLFGFFEFGFFVWIFWNLDFLLDFFLVLLIEVSGRVFLTNW